MDWHKLIELHWWVWLITQIWWIGVWYFFAASALTTAWNFVGLARVGEGMGKTRWMGKVLSEMRWLATSATILYLYWFN